MFRMTVRQLCNKPTRLSKDETCFLVYHPDSEHPYNQTRPLPKDEQKENSILKANSRNMITKAPNLEQLQALTRTPTRYWYEYIGRDKRDKYKEYFNDNVDRKGLMS